LCAKFMSSRLLPQYGLRRFLSALQHLPPPLNGLALGIGGVGILWRDIATLYGIDTAWNSPDIWPRVIAHAFAYLCHTVTALFLLAYASKAIFHWSVFWSELKVCSKVASISSGPMALATVSTSLVRANKELAQVTWIVALVLHMCCTIFFLASAFQPVGKHGHPMGSFESSCVGGHSDAPENTTSDSSCTTLANHDSVKTVSEADSSSPWNPSAFPPTVGIAALASCSTGIDFSDIAEATFFIGCCWAVIILLRIVVQTWTTRGFELHSRTAILAAPFALCSAALWTVSGIRENGLMTHAMFDLLFYFLHVTSLLLAFVVLAHAPYFYRQGAIRAPASAALTFPTVIVAISLVRSTSFEPPLGYRITQAISWIASLLATLTVFVVFGQYSKRYLCSGVEPDPQVNFNPRCDTVAPAFTLPAPDDAHSKALQNGGSCDIEAQAEASHQGSSEELSSEPHGPS